MRAFPKCLLSMSVALVVGLALRPRESAHDSPAGACPSRPDVARSLQATRFLPNQGQWDPQVRYAVLGETTGWVHDDGFTLRFARRGPRDDGPERRPRPEQIGGIVRTRFVGARTSSVESGEALPGAWNFLCGADPAHWREGIVARESVTLRGVLPGIDVRFRPRTGGGACEYDLELAAGADLSRFVARCEGAESLSIDAEGRLCLVVPTPDGSVVLRQEAPVAWQDGPAGRRPVHVAFRKVDANTYGFAADGLDPQLAATVDPGIVWSSYLGGGSSDSINDLVWRPGVGLWVAGWTGSLDFPTTTGAYRTTGSQDGFVARFAANGQTLTYGTYLGGSSVDEIRGIDLGTGLQPVVVGFTHSTDFPVTSGAYQANYAGASLVVDIGDAFVARLSATGAALVGATYLGGMFDEVAESVAVDPAGYACVAGWTSSGNFPTTPGSWQPALGGPLTLQTDGFIARIAPDARTAAYCTFAGGTLPDQLLDIAVDAATGEAVAVGWSVSANFPVTSLAYRTTNAGSLDMVAVRLNAAGSNAVWSTYLGGVHEDFLNCVTLASDGSVWVGGTSNSANFPTTPGAVQRTAGGGNDGVICHLSANGTTLLASTFHGGAGADQVRALATDGATVLAVGETTGGIPVTPSAAQPQFAGGGLDGFVAWYSQGLTSLDYATYVGGSLGDVLDSVAFDASGLAVIGGWSFSADFPVTANGYQTQLHGVEDGVLLEFDVLTDLGEGVDFGSSGGGVRYVGAGAQEVLDATATNQTSRTVHLDALRLLLAGAGTPSSLVQSIEVWRDDPNTTAERDELVGGPIAAPLLHAETSIPLQGVAVPAGGQVRLRVVVNLGAPPTTTAEVACATIDAGSFTLHAEGANGGPAVRVLGTGRLSGPSLVLGRRPGDLDGDALVTAWDLRRLCARLGDAESAADADGDLVLTIADADAARDALLGRPRLLANPTLLQRGQWATFRGVFPPEAVVEATLGGRAVALGTLTPRELLLRVDSAQPAGLQELRISIDGRSLFVGTVQVQ